jgi:ParB family chromosome partitioning protein
MQTLKMKISAIKIEEPFKSLFPVKYEMLSAIKADIELNGFDESQTITIWKEKKIVVDGHTRLQAAKEIGLKSIPVYMRSFTDENKALEFAIHKQRDRRNLSDGDILYLVEKLDELLPKGGDRKSNFGNPKIEDSHKSFNTKSRVKRIHEEIREKTQEDQRNDSRYITAELIGISPDKVSQCRHITNNCNKKEKKKVTEGELSLHQLYQRSLLAKRTEKKKLEQDEKNRIILKELKSTDFPLGKQYGENLEKHDNLIFKLLPKLYKCEKEMFEIRKTVEYFKSQDEDVFNIFCSRKPVQQFLGHLFTSDFIALMQCFGYKIDRPASLKVIEQKRIHKVDRRKGKMPKFSIEKVHEPDFITKRERKERDDRIARAGERDLSES